MHRRELLRLLSTSAIVPVFSPHLFAILQQAQSAAGYALRTLNAYQNDTVVVMAELIIPATDTPGAKGARVNEFIDVILTDWATVTERQHFLVGLDDVDGLSTKRYSRNFIDLSADQQTAVIQTLDAAIDWTHQPAIAADASSEERDSPLYGEFFRVFKTLTLHGYYTSEIGFTQELKLEIIPGAQHGCVPVPAGKKA